MIFSPAFLLGIIAGLRAMIAPAAVSWAAYLGLIDLSGTWLSFAGSLWTCVILTIAVVAELISDQLPSTPKRTVPPQFGARIFMGAASGVAMGAAHAGLASGLIVGIVGAVVGTFVGLATRSAMARRLGADRPAAIIEDVVALGSAALIVLLLA
jgi:uncharacterized membrane protein